jgi:FtsZ-binding cell division protein ZapB
MFSRKIRAYKLANPNATAKEIAEVVGVRVNYVYQALRFKPKRVKKVKSVVETKPTEGQKIIRDEIDRLNKEKETLQMFYDVAEDRNQELDEENHQLKMDIVGYRAVISYLQGQIDGITV